MNQDDAYKTGRDFFLKHYDEDYTHFIIVPDDLIVTEEQIESLFKCCTERVISGWCVHGKTYEPRVGLDTNISFHLFKGEPNQGKYEDYQHVTVAEAEKLVANDDALQEVGFSGFAPTIIPRWVLEKISFRSSAGCCVDSCFAQDLEKEGIPQFVDFRVKTVELKRADLDIWGHLGKKEPQVIFEK